MEDDLITKIQASSGLEQSQRFLKLLTLRFEKYKDKLVDHEDATLQGRAKECRELIKILKLPT